MMLAGDEINLIPWSFVDAAQSQMDGPSYWSKPAWMNGRVMWLRAYPRRQPISEEAANIMRAQVSAMRAQVSAVHAASIKRAYEELYGLT